MKLVKKEAGVYRTEDGRYEVEKGHAFTDCVEPHPVRISADLRQQAREATGSIWEKPKAVPQDAWDAARRGKRGYLCQGGEEHAYVSWSVADRQTDQVLGGGEHFDTKTEAVGFLERHLAREGAAA